MYTFHLNSIPWNGWFKHMCKSENWCNCSEDIYPVGSKFWYLQQWVILNRRGPIYTNSIITLFVHLHWLPVDFGIRFELGCLAYTTLITSTPTYLNHRSLLTSFLAACNLLAQVFWMSHDVELSWGGAVFVSAPKESTTNGYPSHSTQRLQAHFESILHRWV